MKGGKEKNETVLCVCREGKNYQEAHPIFWGVAKHPFTPQREESKGERSVERDESLSGSRLMFLCLVVVAFFVIIGLLAVIVALLLAVGISLLVLAVVVASLGLGL